MTLEQLRIFIAVAEREHVTNAARDLNLTQSATSAAIAALEARYATKLFDRVGRRIVLTDAGRLFLPEAKAVLARASAAEEVLADLADMARGSLKIAASQTVANYWLPPLLQQYRSRFPGIRLQVEIGNTEGVQEAVCDHSADLGFVEGEIEDGSLVITPVADDELVLVVPRNHAWARKAPKSPDEFRASPWVLREPGSGTRSILEAELKRMGVTSEELEIVLELPSNEAVRAAVEAGAGATLISRIVVEGSLKAGRLALVDAAMPRRRFLALSHRERHPTRALTAFMNLVRNQDA